MAIIDLLGLAANDPVPGNYLQINFAQGPASSGQTDYSVLLFANKLSTGAGSNNVVYGPDTATQLQSEQDVIDLAGAGSEAHRMWRRFNKVNKSSSLYMIFVAEASGAQADGYIGLSESTALSDTAGTLRIIIGDEVIDVGFASASSPSSILSDAEDAINERTHLPVTAAASGAGLTLTAKQVGLRGNDIRYSAQVVPASGTDVVVTPTVRTNMANGSGSDDFTAALAVVEGQRFYYQVSPTDSSSVLADLGAQIDSDAAPLIGVRNRFVAGSTDTLANTVALATGLNQARGELVWQENSDWTPAELASNAAAVYSLFESALGARYSLNFNGFGLDSITSQFWRVPAPLDGTTVSRASQKSALNNGISPLVNSAVGTGSYLAKRVTTRSLLGSTADYRIRDAHKVTVADRFGDDLVAKANLQLGGRTIANDPLPGQTVADTNIVTPSVFKNLIIQLLRQYNAEGLLQNVDDIVSGLQVVRETSPSTRISARVPLQVIDILNQTGTVVDEVSAG